MALVSILVAAVATFALGAAWYMALARPWIEASGVPVDEQGRPAGGAGPALYGASFVCILIVAGMMRHMLASTGIQSPGAGLVAGLGVGLFFIAPWITLNVLYSARPLKLAAIDGGYAALGCAVMGLVLGLF